MPYFSIPKFTYTQLTVTLSFDIFKKAKTAKAEVSSETMERPTMFEAFLLSTLAKAFTLSKSAEERVLCRIRPVLHIANVESNPIAHRLYQRVDTDLMIINLDGCELVAINSSPDTILDCQITEIPYQPLFVRTIDARQNSVYTVCQSVQ